MTLRTFPLGPLETNCYLLSEGTHAVILDPADRGDALADLLEKEGLTLDAICLTHVHYDHIGGLAALHRRTGAAVYLHPADLSVAGAMSGGLLTVDTLPYPETVTAGDLRLSVLHTPGHSPGSVCLLGGGVLFTGDTLFAQSCGRTDFAGGSWTQLRASLNRLAALEQNLTVFPGHGPETTLDRERRENPYLCEAECR